MRARGYPGFFLLPFDRKLSSTLGQTNRRCVNGPNHTVQSHLTSWERHRQLHLLNLNEEPITCNECSKRLQKSCFLEDQLTSFPFC